MASNMGIYTASNTGINTELVTGGLTQDFCLGHCGGAGGCVVRWVTPQSLISLG